MGLRCPPHDRMVMRKQLTYGGRTGVFWSVPDVFGEGRKEPNLEPFAATRCVITQALHAAPKHPELIVDDAAHWLPTTLAPLVGDEAFAAPAFASPQCDRAHADGQQSHERQTWKQNAGTDRLSAGPSRERDRHGA